MQINGNAKENREKTYNYDALIYSLRSKHANETVLRSNESTQKKPQKAQKRFKNVACNIGATFFKSLIYN